MPALGVRALPTKPSNWEKYTKIQQIFTWDAHFNSGDIFNVSKQEAKNTPNYLTLIFNEKKDSSKVCD